MESVNLHVVLKDRMVQRVRELAIQIRTAEREMSDANGELGSAARPAPRLSEAVPGTARFSRG